MRARRYSLLYPNFSVDDEAIATVHDELYQVPEEYPREPSAPASIPELNPDEPLSLVYEKKDSPPPNAERSLSSSSLLSILPNSGDLPEIPDLPLLAFDGSSLTQKQANDDAWAFTEAYRRDIGGCKSETEVTKREPNSALDLFCHFDQVYDPMNVQVPDVKTWPRPVATHGKPRVDEDVIPEAQKESAEKEASAHLARQAGKNTPSQPKDKGDEGKESQDEFQAQMNRQKKQAGHGEEKKAVGDAVDKSEESELEMQSELEMRKQELDEKLVDGEEDLKRNPAPEKKGPGW